jgi:peptide/nickel transport system permease protein
MRFIDALMTFPMILLALIFASLLGGGLKNVMIALGISLLPGYARIMCGQVLSVKETDYIIAEHALGARNLRVMLRHILPNCFPPMIVLITLQMGAAILAEAGLSFLGIGIEPPGAAWGAMVNDGYHYLITNPILSFAPGMAIMLVVFSFNMVGDGLRDALDPRLRGVI